MIIAMRIILIILFVLFVPFHGALAQSQQPDPTVERMMIEFSRYCMSSIGNEAQLIGLTKGELWSNGEVLPEVSEQSATAFLNGGKGRVWMIPDSEHNIVLVYSGGYCSIAARRVDVKALRTAFEEAFYSQYFIYRVKRQYDKGNMRHILFEIQGKDMPEDAQGRWLPIAMSLALDGKAQPGGVMSLSIIE